RPGLHPPVRAHEQDVDGALVDPAVVVGVRTDEQVGDAVAVEVAEVDDRAAELVLLVELGGEAARGVADLLGADDVPELRGGGGREESSEEDREDEASGGCSHALPGRWRRGAVPRRRSPRGKMPHRGGRCGAAAGFRSARENYFAGSAGGACSRSA